VFVDRVNEARPYLAFAASAGRKKVGWGKVTRRADRQSGNIIDDGHLGRFLVQPAPTQAGGRSSGSSIKLPRTSWMNRAGLPLTAVGSSGCATAPARLPAARHQHERGSVRRLEIDTGGGRPRCGTWDTNGFWATKGGKVKVCPERWFHGAERNSGSGNTECGLLLTARAGG